MQEQGNPGPHAARSPRASSPPLRLTWEAGGRRPGPSRGQRVEFVWWHPEAHGMTEVSKIMSLRMYGCELGET